MISCVRTSTLCSSFSVHVCVYVFAFTCVFVAQTQMEKGRRMTWLYSSFPARSSAVVSPVTKWTCMILLISLLPSTLSSLQVWKIHPTHMG